jgi:DNA polymerase-3 subunit beta
VEQLNIVGKRSGDGFVAHKATLVSALSRALASRVVLMDLTIGRKGLLGYLKAVGGSNVAKVTPSNGSASGSQATDKRLRVICGGNTSTIADSEWIGEKTPLTLCEVRVSPNNSVKPNVGVSELAEALARVLPFTAKDDNRPVLQCVSFVAKDGKLTLVSADGFRLAITSLDYDDGEGQALISRDELKGVANALKRAKRARVGFEPSGESLDGMSLILDTELIRYKWVSVSGQFPDWQKLIPTEFNTYAHFDTVEAIKAANSLKVLSDSKAYPIDLTIGDGKVTMANPDDKGQADIPADTDGEGFVRIDGQYLADALKACGGMVDFSLTNAYSPMMFSLDGYQLVVMPMLTDKANEQAKADREAKGEATTTEQAESAEGEPEAEPQPEATEPADKPKGKRSRAKQPASAK